MDRRSASSNKLSLLQVLYLERSFRDLQSLNKASFFRSLKNSLTVPDKTKLLAVYSLLINSIQSVTLAPSFGNSVAH